MRLIDADALGNRMYYESFEKDSDLQRWDGGCWIRYKLFEQVLRAAPTIDPTPSNTFGALDCIERQKAIEAIEEMQKPIMRSDFFHEQFIFRGMSEARQAIIDLPSVQPERKKGHWVEIGDEPYDEWECDMCGFVIDGSGCIDPEKYKDVYKFCPNCGADMRGEQE